MVPPPECEPFGFSCRSQRRCMARERMTPPLEWLAVRFSRAVLWHQRMAPPFRTLNYLEETQQWLSNVDSEIRMREEEITELDKSIEAKLPQINAFNEELAHLNPTSSNKDLSSRLALLFAQLEPFKKELKKHQAKLDNASYRKKLMSQKVPSTDFTKLIEAQSDATISAEKLEIQKVTQASKHLTDQATELQSQLDSGTLNLKTQRQKISRIIS
ncbi:hypothetical protein Tco_1206647, partial [Tanacetum coccineum]